MNKSLVNHHAGQVLVESEFHDEYLCGIYDNTHPILICRGRINLIGGGKDKEDISPRGTVEREVEEEFALQNDVGPEEIMIQDSGKLYEPPRIEKMASEADITALRKAILENMIPYQDFLVRFQKVPGGPTLKNPYVIFSVFHSVIGRQYFDLARKNLAQGKSLTNDGFLTIVTPEGLEMENP